MVTEDGPHLWDSWVPLPPGENIVVLAGRATRVPQAAVTSGMQRSVTVTSRGPLSWMLPTDLGLRQGATLHGMQGVRVQSPYHQCHSNVSEAMLGASSRTGCVNEELSLEHLYLGVGGIVLYRYSESMAAYR